MDKEELEGETQGDSSVDEDEVNEEELYDLILEFLRPHQDDLASLSNKRVRQYLESKFGRSMNDYKSMIRNNVQKALDDILGDGKEREKNVEVEKSEPVPLSEVRGYVERLEKVTAKNNTGLRLLHRIAFGSVGKSHLVKKVLKEFSGWKSEEETEKKIKSLKNSRKVMVSDLKEALRLLGQKQSGKKDELCEKLVRFMANPTSSGGSGRSGKRKRRARKEPAAKKKRRLVKTKEVDESDELSVDE